MYKYNLGLLFNKIANEYERNICIKTMDEKVFTYKQINELSERIASLVFKSGIFKRDVIAIVNNKSVEAFATMIACLKIGVTYINLDPNTPIERLKKMLHIGNPKAIFTFDENANNIKTVGYPVPHFNYSASDFKDKIQQYKPIAHEIVNGIEGNTPAYIMFTSGSTGFPKGVAISHANVLNFIEWSKSTYRITSDDVFTNINPLHFDNSVFDFYSALFTGATLIPVTDDYLKNPKKMIERLNLVKPTIWFSVPSMLVYALRLRSIRKEDLPTLRVVTFGGEGFPKGQLRQLWELWGNRVQFINVYGPTECTCICSSYIVTEKDISSDELLPLGPMAPNFYCFILDQFNKRVNDGEVGELCIGGPNVGLGYYNNHEKTKEVFVQNPQNTVYPEIIYKSGDLVKYDTKRNVILFLGRKDNQIKRMGHRIELEEIENALAALKYITENAVVFYKTNDNNGKIIAHVVSVLNDSETIIEDLRAYLPGYMMPDKFQFYDELPKNQNGKIDRLQLKGID